MRARMFGWFRKAPPPPPKLYDAYRFAPQADITAYELASILAKVGTSPVNFPFGQVVITSVGVPIPQPVTRHFEPWEQGISMERASMLPHLRAWSRI